ncbi:MAG: hypothetical protein ACI8VC_001801 [Candidatus Endobugula sp.]|jgi:hypothetical protein
MAPSTCIQESNSRGNYSYRKKFNLISFLFVSFIFLDLVSKNYIYNSLYPSLILFFIYALVYFYKGKKLDIYPLGVSLLMVFWYFLIQSFQHNGIFGFINILMSMLLGAGVYRGLVSPRHIAYLISFFLVICLWNALEAFNYGISVFKISNHIAINASRNLISIHFIFLTTLYYFVARNDKRDISITPALICFIVTILAGGRSGILSSAILLSVVFLYSGNGSLIFRVIIILSAISLAAFNYTASVLDFFTVASSDIRFSFIANYFSSYNMSNLVSGFDVKNAQFLSEFNGNPHNSYLNLLSIFGFGGILFLFFTVLSSFLLMLRKDYFPILIVTPFMIRMFTDSGLFTTSYDLLFYAYFSLSLKKHKKYDFSNDYRT